MNILLVYPKFPEKSFWKFNHALRFIGKKASLPPMGLLTAMHDQFPEVDHFVLNEAEITLPQFVEDLERGCPRHMYNTDQWADISMSPAPLWNLIDLKNYASMCIQYSRGCPFDCDFCDITVLFGRRPRTKSVGNILNELEALYRRGWRGNVFFVDDNFIGNKKTIKRDLLPAIIAWMKYRKYPFRFQTQASINLADDEALMQMMADAGFEAVFVGIETPEEESLIECGKLQNTRGDILKSVKKLQKAGFQVQGGFIVGFDSDKTDIFTRMSRFINESGIVTSMVGLLNAPRGSKLYKRLAKENRLIREATGDNTDCSMNFIPKMDVGTLRNGYRQVIDEIYRPDAYYKRLETFLKNYKCATKFKRRFSKENVRAVMMSVYKLGIRQGIRRHFWTLMFTTLFRRPRSMPIAINLAIYSYQFMRYFDIKA